MTELPSSPISLRNRNVVLSDFDWSKLPLQECGQQIVELLTVVCHDTPDAVAALSRALEGAEYLLGTGHVLDADVAAKVFDMTTRLRVSVATASSNMNLEWLIWSLDALMAISGSPRLDATAHQEARLFLRSARLACECYCTGLAIRNFQTEKADRSSIVRETMN